MIIHMMMKCSMNSKFKIPEYDPYTGERNPYLIDTKAPSKSYTLSTLYYIFLSGTIIASLNVVFSILMGDAVSETLAWLCAVVYSVGCSIYERMRCKRIL